MDYSVRLNSVYGSTTSTTSTTSQQVAVEDTQLFGAEDAAKTEVSSNTNLLEAELARLESELKLLEEQKTQKSIEKQQLEAQKKTLEAKKQQLQADIAASNEKIYKEIASLEADKNQFNLQQKELTELEKQYDAKTKDAAELSELLNEKIDEILAKAEEEQKIQKDKMKAAMAEANAKVESGEITESEVEAYVAKKIGVEGFSSATSQMFSVVNALNGQLRAAIKETSTLLTQITTKQASMTVFNEQMVAKNEAVNGLIVTNSAKKSELSKVNSEIALVDSEITILNGDISSLDNSISQKNIEIQMVKAEIAGTKNLDFKVSEAKVAVNSLALSREFKAEDNSYDDLEVINNPFVAISFVATDYSNMVTALDAMTVTAERRVNLAREFIKVNNEENRKACK